MKKVFVFAALLVAAAVSCTVEIAPEEKPIAPKVGYVEISLNASIADTKATLDGKNVVWEAGEKVAVFTSASAEPEEFTVESVNGSSVTISGSVPETATSFIAAFPYENAVSCTENVVKMNVAYSQELSGEQVVDPSALASVAYFETAASTPVFQNAVALASFSVGLEGVTEVNISTVTSGKLSGEVNVTVSSETDPAVGAASDSSITVSKSDGFTTGVTYYAAIAPCSIEGLSVSITKEGKRSTRTSTSSVSVARNQVLTLGEQNGGETWKYGIISNAAQLKDFLSVASTYVKSDVVELANDIDCSGVAIGQAASYAGKFDGKGHSLKNLAATTSLFNKLSGIVTDVVIDASCSYAFTTSGQGGFIALNMLEGSTVTKVVNNASATISAAPTGAYKIGMIVGRSDGGYMEDCVNNGDLIIDVQTSAGSHCIGGVLGYFGPGENTDASFVYMKNCVNNGKVSFLCAATPKNTYIGGVVGATPINKLAAAAFPANVGKIQNCTNNGDVTWYCGVPNSGSYLDIGGVIGYSEGVIEGCLNKGNISASNNPEASTNACTRPAIGGVAGYAVFGGKDCENSGKVTLSGVFHAGTAGNAGAGGYHAILAGGVFGGAGGRAYINNTYKVENCTNNGVVSIAPCMRDGLKSPGLVGGIVGFGALDMYYCTNNGDVKPVIKLYQCYLGGMVGYALIQKIDHCTNNGDVCNDSAGAYTTANQAGYQSWVGGMVGYHGYPNKDIWEITNCTNSGNISLIGSRMSKNADGVIINNYVGGMLGNYKSGGHAFYGNTNTGNMYAEAVEGDLVLARLGGISAAMNLSSANAENCSSTGKVTLVRGNSNSLVGGFIGYLGYGGIKNCTCDAIVSSDAPDAGLAGGFIGTTNVDSEWENIQSTGSVVVTGENPGYIGSFLGGFYSAGRNLVLKNISYSATVNGNPASADNMIGFYNGAFVENLSNTNSLFCYAGKKYPIVKLADDRWWMAAPLAYVPEGKTVSSDPVEDAGIWYTYDTDGTNVTPRTDFTDGYLYDYPTAFGVAKDDITYGTREEYLAGDVIGNYRDFEGVQGICPPGWYIPTRPDFLKLVGYSNKDDSLPENPETAAVSDPTAVYWVPAYSGSSIPVFNEAGWNFSFLGVRIKASTAQIGAYNKTATKETTCSVAEWISKPALNQVMCSTPYMPNAAGNNVQYFCMMSTFTAANMLGKLTLSYGNYLQGMEVRCIRKAD